jgi:hypothetical protein
MSRLRNPGQRRRLRAGSATSLNRAAPSEQTAQQFVVLKQLAEALGGFVEPAGWVTRRRVMPSARTAACLLATIAIGGCASSALVDATPSGSALAHGSLTEHDFGVAVAVARAEVDKDSAVLTSATASIGVGTVTDPNAGPPCTSGKLLHINLIGTFPRIVHGGLAGDPAQSPVSAVLITADPVSGKPCLIGVETGISRPEPGAVRLFPK